MRGVLVVDKPAGMTSHDVVNAVRRLTGLRRVGHTGTLDPMATGVLVLLLGPATRLARFVSGVDKRYHAVIQLGATTTTYDAEGEIVERYPVNVNLDHIQAALSTFLGEIEQIPPMVSAIKVQGQRLYELARQGKVIQRQPRPVTFYAIDILDWQSPALTLDIHCSAGTYIRSLAHDLGEKLGCGAYLTALRRTASGSFDLSVSHTIDTLQTRQGEHRMREAMLPTYAVLGDMPLVTVTPEEETKLRYGQRLDVKSQRLHVKQQPIQPGTYVQARNADDHLIAVMVMVDDNQYQPKVVLPPPEA